MSAAAVRVSPEWLVLREPADAAARSAELAERLGRHLPAAGRLVIHDLGGGSGAMGRWLAPRLPGPQHWVVHDRDADLLELAVADAAGRRPRSPSRRRRSDITRLAPGDLAGASLVVASALLDLLTADELARMLARLRRASDAARADRRRSRRPDPGGSAGRAHRRGVQRPPAPRPACSARTPSRPPSTQLRGTGAEVLVRPSPWRLDAAHADLTAEWLGGWVAAACEQEPALAAEAGAYRDRRLAQAAAGELAVTVDHADLLVLP